MAVVTTNLGVITAYGDAVAAGYKGTKAEWQALMANYATVGQQAARDAQTASQAAQTATTKAGEASQSATRAETVAASITTPDTTLTQAGVAADAKVTGDKVSELKEGLNVENGKLNSVNNKISITWDANSDGKYIAADGNIRASTGFHYSNLMPVVLGESTFVFDYNSTSSLVRIHGYDNSGAWVQQLAYADSVTKGMVFTVPSGVDFIRVSISKSAENCVYYANLSDVRGRLETVEKDLQTLETAYDTYSTVPVTWDSDYDGKYINDSGNIGNSESFHCSDLLVACYGSAEFKFDYSGTSVSVRIHGYNNAGVWVQQLGYATNITSGKKIAFSIPDNVAYLRISVPKTASNIVLNESVYGWISAQSGENIVTNNVPVVFSESSGGTAINASGLFISAPSHHYTDFLPVYAGSGKLSFAYSGTNVSTRVHGYSINKAWVRELGNLGGVSGGTIDFSIAEDVYYVRVSIAKTATNISLINTTTKDIISKYDIDKTNEARFAMKISSLGYIDDDIDSSGDGTVYTLCGVKNRIVTGKPASPIGWLYMRSPSANEENQTELWYSGNQADKPQYLTTMNGFTPSSSHRDFEISPMHGDIITCRRDNRNNPFIYDAETHTTTLLNGLDINPIGWTSNRGADFAVDGNGNEYFMFGEYTGNLSTQEGYENVYIWKVTYPYNDPENWKIVHTIERSTQYEGSVVGKAWHFHTVQYDPYSGIWYATTGDSDAETVWYYSDDEGETWNILVYASEWESQIARIVCMVFEEDYVWWANDWGTNHSLNRVSRLSSGLIDISSRERIAELDKNQSTYAIVKTGYPNGLLMLDRLELGSLYRDDFFVQFYSFDDNMLHNLLNIKRLGERPTTDYSSSFGFRCKTYALRQSSFDTRIAVGFDSIYPNTMQIQGNEENNRLWTLFLDIT